MKTNKLGTHKTVYMYKDTPITIVEGGKHGAMVNATQIGKAFKKKPCDWLKLDSTQSFLKELMIPIDELIEKHKHDGTWMQIDIGLEFADWVNPELAKWYKDNLCNLSIEKSVSTVETKTPSTSKKKGNSKVETALIHEAVKALEKRIKAAEDAYVCLESKLNKKIWFINTLIKKDKPL